MVSTATGQTDSTDVIIDSNYREDQFYLGLSFNILNEKPIGLSQTGFSGGVFVGAMRDFPLNKRRNIAIAVGLGWAFNTYNQNLGIYKNSNNNTLYTILGDEEYDTNRFNTFSIEVPIEFRWRTSTPTVYNFWRIYPGFKFGYIYGFKSKFLEGDHEEVSKNPDGLERIRFGATLSMGKANFNVNFYYGLNPMFEGITNGNTDIEFSVLKIGLIFYIL